MNPFTSLISFSLKNDALNSLKLLSLLLLFFSFQTTTFSQIDTDGDGVFDTSDLDSDNDGIPDAIECPAFSTAGGGFGPLVPVTVNAEYTSTQDDFVITYTKTGTGNIDPYTESTVNANEFYAAGTSVSYIYPFEGATQIMTFSESVFGSFAITDVDQAGESHRIKIFDTNGVAISNPAAYISTSGTGTSGTAPGTPTVFTDLGTNLTITSGADFVDLSPTTSGAQNTFYRPNMLFFEFLNFSISRIEVENRGASGTGQPGFLFNIIKLSRDTDNDGIVACLDLDSDNDGIPDMVEAGAVDSNGDGLIDYPTPNDPTSIIDLDGDGLADAYDDTDSAGGTSGWTNGIEIGSLDSDGDGISNFLDLDADNDGIPDIIEAGGVDSNGDGLVDGINPDGTLITDADGDGYADIFDTDDDGVAGVEDATDALLMIGGTDTNGDGLANDAAITFINGENVNLDTDGDGLMDGIDLDADNDGIPDLVEAGGIDIDGNGLVDVLTDADNDGFADIFDTDNNGVAGIDDATLALLKTGGTDTDGDGKADDTAITFVDGANVSADTDGDGFVDHLDLDADNDGIPDIVEAGGSTPNADGKVNTIAAPWDSDNDGLADIYDENNSGTSLVKTTSDTNADGKVNATESMSAGGSNTINIDGDAYPNHLDLDADNDGITDVVENAGGATTADNSTGTLDGIVGDNPTVTDIDTDGWHDPSTTVTLDSDADGIPDYLDIDADNDGIVDYLEGVCSTCPTFVAPSGNDVNGNGVLDMYESLTSANGTGGSNIGASPNVDDDSVNSIPDYLDTDSDSDGAMDWTEGYDLNNDGQASDDLMTMAANYESATSNGYYVNATDTDSDGIPDWLDNQPSVTGYDESARPPFMNPASSFWFDDDNDGLVDLLDASQSGTAAPTPDNNGGNDLDWRDMTTVVSLPVELSRFFVKENDCKVELNWTTQSEIDFDYFEIQWSRDGHDFTKVDRVASKGNINGGDYKTVHETDSETNYYRLKMVDLDGSFEMSNIEFAKRACGEPIHDFEIYPNPISKIERLNISFFTNNRNAKFTIIDILGRPVRSLNVETTEGWNKIDLDISDLNPANYLLKMENGIDIQTKQFIILK